MNDSSPSGPVDSESSQYTVLGLYKFFVLPAEASDLKRQLERFLLSKQVRGVILLATNEGINGTISYPSVHDSDIRTFLKKICLEEDTKVLASKEEQYKRLRFCTSFSSSHVFFRLRVRLKQEIVSMGVPLDQIIPDFAKSQEEGDENHSKTKDCHGSCAVGKYVKPGGEWHALLNDPQCLVIDTRNEYEVDLGTFENATNPHTTSFTEFPEWFKGQLQSQSQSQRQPRLTMGADQKQTSTTEDDGNQSTNAQTVPTVPAYNKIAMFCTGGIRCEKASAYCLSNLPKHVPLYHLEGGILNYLKQVDPSESMWRGDCYVFDHRIAVTHGLKPSNRYPASCHACRHPLSQQDLLSPDFCEGISCSYCIHNPDKEQRRERYVERQRQMELSKERRTPHMHDPRETSYNAQM